MKELNDFDDNDKSDFDFDAKESSPKNTRTKLLMDSKPRNNIKRNEVERLLNDLTAGNCNFFIKKSFSNAKF